ncbi:hypothetical protein CARG_02555 [Corynebacterium argentoratense DSM 44202]|uniref:Uncharacterized protein n=1 Tax=Corynebacterium argentoratense DSM 44202 TaxID=1348662 RepID=U3GT96_9CORY|nr:hypothetical protein [Corynebacterium argentoratense]AGU14670.1 hypothetical protein CARG_02555 [Corynebacterium argentoratense DSM 44202]
MSTSNPWIRYRDVLEVIERSTNQAMSEKLSAQSQSDWVYWDGIKENCRVMGVNVAGLAVTTPQPPTAEMIEARTLARVIDCIDAITEKALSSREEQAQAAMLLGLKNLRAELRSKQDKLLGE